MKSCKCFRRRKHLAYGQTKGKYWCDGCDANQVNTINKSAERQKAKREIRKEFNRMK